MNNRLQDAALSYLERGWSICPLKPENKKPLFSWQKYQTEQPSRETVIEWWTKWPDANIGIITGEISGIIVLDIDGPEGELTLSNLTKSGEIPETPISSTGKGKHYFFKHPGGEYHNFAGKLPGLDFRGDGGYIVAPPSIHPSGKEYAWSIPPENVEPALPPGWLMDLITAPKRNITVSQAEKNDWSQVLEGVPEGQRNGQLFRYACHLRANKMGKQEAAILLLEAARKCTPPFPEKEVNAILDSAWKYLEGTSNERKLAEACSILENISDRIDDLFEPETIGALAILKKSVPTNYGKVKSELKGKCNLNDLELAVNRAIAEMQKLHLVKEPDSSRRLTDILPNSPIECRIPSSWNISENGIWQQTNNGPICACSAPVVITKRLQNIDTSEEKVELSFYRDNCWNSIRAERATMFSRSSLISLANQGLPVNSENARYLVRYLNDFENSNLDLIPRIRSTGRLGWITGNSFYPGAVGDVIIDTGNQIVNGYKEVGTLEDWVRIIEPLRQHPLARFFISASFAAPLLKLIGQRVFILHLWGPSKGGKTAALKAALSVWGNPEELIASFNATKVGLERLAGFYCDLPIGIDERQVIGDRQELIESMVYMLGSGKGKIRGTKNGGLQPTSSWRTIILTTGEEPLSSESSMAGVKTRVLELYGAPIQDEKLSTQIHLLKNYGVAGPVFIQRLISEFTKSSDILSTDYNLLIEYLAVNKKENISSHLTAIATLFIADYYSSQWIFGLSEEDSFNQAMGLVESISNMLDVATDNDDSIRAYEHFLSWYDVHQKYFTLGTNARYGFDNFDEPNLIFIFNFAFKKAMEDGGFNSKRVLRDWAERDLIETSTLGGKKRFQVRKWDTIAKKQSMVIVIKKTNTDQLSPSVI